MTRFSKKVGAAVGAAALLVSAACSTDLEVTNPNNPDITRALAAPEDVKNIAISTVNSWYLTSTDYDPFMMLEVTADALTGNFGNFGMRFNNVEPRIAYGNSSAGADRRTTEAPWNGNYAVLGSANDVIRAFDRGVALATPAETEKYRQLAMFTQALSLTNLALLFDRAFIVDEKSDLAVKPELQPYKDVATAALTKWDALIAASNGKTHTYDPSVLPMTVGPLNSSRINRIANTMAAITLAYTPRSAAEAQSTPWARVEGYAEKGISGSAGAPFDVRVIGDNNNWYSYINYYGNENSWTRADMRLIKAMDSTQVARYTGAADQKPASPTADARLTTDFQFHANVIGDPARGIWMQSPWSHKRYVDHSRSSPTAAQTPVPYLLATENDLLLAEALVRQNKNLGRAADLINATRVTRGKLAPVTASDPASKLIAAIQYERDVELLNTNGFDLFRRRIFDGLQPGTVRHLPIPAKELETLALPIYTFGGVGQPDRIMTPAGETLELHSSRSARPPRYLSIDY